MALVCVPSERHKFSAPDLTPETFPSRQSPSFHLSQSPGGEREVSLGVRQTFACVLVPPRISDALLWASVSPRVRGKQVSSTRGSF